MYINIFGVIRCFTGACTVVKWSWDWKGITNKPSERAQGSAVARLKSQRRSKTLDWPKLPATDTIYMTPLNRNKPIHRKLIRKTLSKLNNRPKRTPNDRVPKFRSEKFSRYSVFLLWKSKSMRSFYIIKTKFTVWCG